MTAFVPTEEDRQTGQRLRQLRKRRGETMQETIDRSGIGIKQSAFSKTELGDRRLTEIEAAKLAAHFNVAVSQILPSAPLPAVETEQAWLGNDDRPALFAVPDQVKQIDAPVAGFGKTLVIDLDNPPSPDEYRLTVWLPYLEARYATETKAG